MLGRQAKFLLGWKWEWVGQRAEAIGAFEEKSNGTSCSPAWPDVE